MMSDKEDINKEDIFVLLLVRYLILNFLLLICNFLKLKVLKVY